MQIACKHYWPLLKQTNKRGSIPYLLKYAEWCAVQISNTFFVSPQHPCYMSFRASSLHLLPQQLLCHTLKVHSICYHLVLNVEGTIIKVSVTHSPGGHQVEVINQFLLRVFIFIISCVTLLPSLAP